MAARKKRVLKIQKRVKLVIPPWVVKVYTTLAFILLPWIVYLSVSLPRHHTITHYDITWAGLDIGLVFIFLLTALLAYKKSRWVAMTATASGSFLLLDAWFDILGARAGFELKEAIILAAFIEIPLALISFSLAGHVLMRNID
jgi:hypothetical protein